jgi:hypothetical protein
VIYLGPDGGRKRLYHEVDPESAFVFRTDRTRLAFRYKQFHNALMCAHALLPVLSRDSTSDEILGWECVFCNEHFESYPVSREPDAALATLGR